jgi:hypothetical protein
MITGTMMMIDGEMTGIGGAGKEARASQANHPISARLF